MDEIKDAKRLLTESYVEISHDDTNGIIIARWKGYLTLQQVIKGAEVLTRFIAESNIRLHLSDHSQLKVLSKEVQEYLVGTWFNEVEALGLRKIAVKLAEDVFAQATVKNVNTKQQTGQLRIDSFQDYASAYAWLKK